MLYLYPTTIGDDVLDAMAESEKVCQYIDLPLQHASDAVLKRMKRPGTRAGYERLLDRIRHARARASRCARRSSSASPARPTRTSPSCRASSKPIEFDHVGVFTYSHEEGTSAHGLADDVPARRQAAAPVAADAPAEAASSRGPSGRAIGQQVRLLVDGPSAEHELVLRARLEGQAPDIDPLVYLTDCDPSELSRRAVHRGRNRRQPRLRPAGPAASAVPASVTPPTLAYAARDTLKVST